MGKLRSPNSPPARGAPSTIPRMDPPPPYEASSSRSSSAHSNDRLQPERSTSNQQPGLEAIPMTQSGRQQAPSSPAVSDTKRKPADGCLTWGDNAQGCMNYGDHARGCMNIGDHSDGCMNYGDNTDGCMNYKARNGCLLFEATNGGCLNFWTNKSGCCQCG